MTSNMTANNAKRFVARHFRISDQSSSDKRLLLHRKNCAHQPHKQAQHSEHQDPLKLESQQVERLKRERRIPRAGNWITVRNQILGPDYKTRSLKASKARVWRALVAEFFGIMIFVFFATGSVVLSLRFDPTGGALANLVVAFGQAFALAIGIYYSANVSGGHLNPVVTLSFVLVGRMRFIVAFLYWIVQIAGAIVASALLRAIIPDDQEGVLGATTLAPGYSTGRGVLLEAILTFTLVSTIYATAIDKIGFGKTAPLAIGLSIFIDLLIGWKFTGGSMNPARSFGPAVISGEWSHHWVYWVGPFIGAVIAAVLYDFVLISRPANQNPFSAGTRMETEGRPVLAVPEAHHDDPNSNTNSMTNSNNLSAQQQMQQEAFRSDNGGNELIPGANKIDASLLSTPENDPPKVTPST